MAVAFVNTNTPGQSGTGSVSATMTVTNSGTNLCAFILLTWDNAASESISAVTLGGVTCTSAGAAVFNASENNYAQIWYLASPPTGTPTLSVTSAGSPVDIYYNVSVFNGVNQTTPVRAGSYTTTTGTVTTSVVIPSSTNDLTVACGNSGASGYLSPSGYTNQTGDGENNGGSYGFATGHSTTASASVTFTFTTNANGHQAVAGLSINGDLGSSALTLYLNNPIQGGSNAGLLALSAPTASTSTTGWTVGSTAAAQYSRGTYNTEVPAANFTATAQPSGAPVNLGEDCYRLSAQTSGVFSADTWYSAVSVIAVTSGGIQDGRARFRYWRSLSADGTSATEITQGIMVGSRITELSTIIAQSSSASTQIASLTLNNEYLFLQLGWETL